MFHSPRRDSKIGSSVLKKRWQGVVILARWLTDDREEKEYKKKGGGANRRAM
jgi:hypothetical protein